MISPLKTSQLRPRPNCTPSDMEIKKHIVLKSSLLWFQCHCLGENLTDVVGKYKNYDDSSTDLLKWLGSSEEEARKQQSEAIAAEPQILQIQLEDTKARNITNRICYKRNVEFRLGPAASLLSCKGKISDTNLVLGLIRWCTWCYGLFIRCC